MTLPPKTDTTPQDDMPITTQSNVKSNTPTDIQSSTPADTPHMKHDNKQPRSPKPTEVAATNTALKASALDTDKMSSTDSIHQQQQALPPEKLKRITDLSSLPNNTRRVKPAQDFLGQARAYAAIQTALTLPFDGYNIFAAGTNGLGKRTMIKRMLAEHAVNMPTPNDWVYVNRFDDGRYPRALSFLPGDAPKFKKMMHALWFTLFKQLDKRFATSSYHTQIELIRQKASQIQQTALNELTEEGKTLALRLVSRNEQHCFVPVKLSATHNLNNDNTGDSSDTPILALPLNNANLDMASTEKNSLEPSKLLIQEAIKTNSLSSGAAAVEPIEQEMGQNELAALPKDERERILQNIQTMDKKLERLGLRLGRVEEQAREQVSELNEEIAKEVVLPQVNKVALRFEYVDGLDDYLKQYGADIIEHIEIILAQEDADFLPGFFDRVPTRYQVNVLVSNKPNSGAPIVDEEDMPTYFNLVGYIEQLTQMGMITTDFTLIRAGGLHRANGGFLLLEAEQLLEQPYAWHGLKRALRSGSLKLSSLEHMLTLTGSVSLEPDGIPLTLKVILLGDANLYYEMLELDAEFNAVFKIRADFADTLARTPENEASYIGLIADYVQKKKLLPLDRTALAALLADASRNAEDQQFLSLHAATLGDLLTETSVAAKALGAKTITAAHIQQILEARRYRSGYLRELYWHDLQHGTQLIETTGKRIGQINALTVVHYADSEFGMPARITASVYQGGGDILDIERTVDLGGALHAKGILIMSSFLRAHFGRKQPLHFSAALAFEQSYGEIDGDSATVAELCALISAICQIPIDQSWAITGSMNQLGQIQPIGGINAKIEGFFDTCKLHGLTGAQGVILPEQNTQHLMLRQDVIDAVAKGEFHICAIKTVDEALSILMGQQAGVMDSKGRYPNHTIYATVMQQLKLWQKLESGVLDDKALAKKKKRKKKKVDRVKSN